jgi:DNA polymerase III delta prime subunit
MYINGSEETSIDVVRTKLTQFCASQSMFQNNKKIVIYDEAEAVSNAAFQALRPFIEQYSKNTSFIFITNYKNKFSEPILSRLQSVEFIFTQDEQQVMKREFYKRVIDILAKENVTNYNKKVVAHIVSNLFPDMRKILNEIQKHAQSNNLENLAIIQSLISDCNKYFKLLKKRDFYGIQGFISQTSDPNSFFTQLYNEGVDYVDESSISPYYVLLGDYAYRNSFIVDYRINLTALSMKIINEITLKD